ncbi:type II secretion system protein N [Thermodesulfobacteriota bacterium]
MGLKKILLLINIIVTALILWIGYSAASTWLHNRKDNVGTEASSKKKDPSKPLLVKKATKPENYRVITNRDIFDAAGQAQSADVKKDTEIKVSKRDLELKGTVVGEKGPSYAVILDRKKRIQSLYYINDDVAGARIKKIMFDMVVLDTDGNEEILPLVLEDSSPPSRGRPPVQNNSVKRIRPKVQIKKPGQ